MTNRVWMNNLTNKDLVIFLQKLMSMSVSHYCNLEKWLDSEQREMFIDGEKAIYKDDDGTLFNCYILEKQITNNIKNGYKDIIIEVPAIGPETEYNYNYLSKLVSIEKIYKYDLVDKLNTMVMINRNRYYSVLDNKDINTENNETDTNIVTTM